MPKVTLLKDGVRVWKGQREMLADGVRDPEAFAVAVKASAETPEVNEGPWTATYED